MSDVTAKFIFNHATGKLTYTCPLHPNFSLNLIVRARGNGEVTEEQESKAMEVLVEVAMSKLGKHLREKHPQARKLRLSVEDL